MKESPSSSQIVPMQKPQGSKPKDSLIAALITLLVVGLLLVWLLVATLHYDERLAQNTENP